MVIPFQTELQKLFHALAKLPTVAKRAAAPVLFCPIRGMRGVVVALVEVPTAEPF